ncbi:hypothetical protein EMIHUDRAFT_453510 [Emiliania huxleyi CCMP1516]|uniref:Ig-like domain-containing protein n=2 Tax=Emiliania huxleyi TaxID=2903 RepID=A0A0D3I4B6_EMIH1|nr:hypothetical protein EMIHUDRAFT_453510 [Emiliania huxleyi CCMP1516]EOD06101.1 hypothetical protein EMIHUDRAFT_453510 [Emiliania huxleyi CCMP1516]|eukprot:XP_005758530.1 hypothetical protein EMIHUDRAFT_453510 [Emiliania huxleyi CCMP1516]
MAGQAGYARLSEEGPAWRGAPVQASAELSSSPKAPCRASPCETSAGAEPSTARAAGGGAASRARHAAPALLYEPSLACASLPWWLVLLLQAGLWWTLQQQQPSDPSDDYSVWRDGWAAAAGSHGLCSSSERGMLRFDEESGAFIGCDGSAWSRLAFCCAPDQPEPPTLALAPAGSSGSSNALHASWRPPAAHGSPVVSGERLECTVLGLNASQPHFLWLALQPAPQPVALSALDDGDCAFGIGDALAPLPPERRSGGVTEALNLSSSGDALVLQFDEPTNRPLAVEGSLSAAAVERLLDFSPPAGRSLTLRHGNATHGPGPARDVDLYLAEARQVRVRIKPEGLALVAPPGLSLAADSSSPPLKVPGCFVDGFEVGELRWYAEGSDPEAYNVSVDTASPHSGKHSLRIAGGSGGQFDGLSASLPGASGEPRGISFWLRTSVAGNVGYLALGGKSLAQSVVFFHLRPSGQAGLLSTHGYFMGGNYSVKRWLHARSADLSLDDKLVASNVRFVSDEALEGRTLHVFNSDPGTVWWDDFVVH